MRRFRNNTKLALGYQVVHRFLMDVKCGDLVYGRHTYDYQEGTLVFRLQLLRSFAKRRCTETKSKKSNPGGFDFQKFVEPPCVKSNFIQGLTYIERYLESQC